ncbi:MAG: hypothetical protein BZY80_06805 [SAR202 cluster bacterium Io17-Chloro-G2]|nr:MAG: hypothetical protein BZY80_06805 [SAR202 cluster bacterium Io17-Chloro-G2]
MAAESPMTYDAFLSLANESGLDVGSGAGNAHMEELYSYVKAVLASLRSLNELDVSQVEPDMAFMPFRE